MKPLVIGLSITVAGLVIARIKPKARTLIIYSFAVLGFSAVVIFALAFDNCDKPSIAGSRRGSYVVFLNIKNLWNINCFKKYINKFCRFSTLSLLEYCNRDCKCSEDADFRPICDTNGVHTYYSPCHAGCTSVKYGDTKFYGNCTCIQDRTGLTAGEAQDGPCGSNSCQMGWILYEVGYYLLILLILINLR